jgi:hypothetical protein
MEVRSVELQLELVVEVTTILTTFRPFFQPGSSTNPGQTLAEPPRL